MLTGYQVSEVANDLLKEHGLKEIPSQMVYNYIAHDRIQIVLADGTPVKYDSVKETGTKYFVTVDETKRFVKEFVAARRNPANTKTNVVKNLLAELRDEQ